MITLHSPELKFTTETVIVMRMNENCKACLLGRNFSKYPSGATEESIKEYQNALERIIDENKMKSAPEVVEHIKRARYEYFGIKEEFSDVKRHFNSLMLSYEDELKRRVFASADPVKCAVQYAMAGNFIDFGAFPDVQDDKLKEFLEAADKASVDGKVLCKLKEELYKAKRLVYFTDNCGEIVADKIFLEVIKSIYPHIHTTAIVRGEPVLNDATLDDAKDVGLDKAVSKLIDNGYGIAGNVVQRLKPEALEEVQNADVLISKGQGNFESLGGCKLNIYYIFMCKCELFTKRFNVPLYSGMLVREKDLEKYIGNFI